MAANSNVTFVYSITDIILQSGANVTLNGKEVIHFVGIDFNDGNGIVAVEVGVGS